MRRLLVATALLSACTFPPTPCEAPECEPLPGRVVEVGDARLWLVEHGEGPDVLLLHGIPTSSYLWRNVQRDLAADCRTLAPDLAGLGHSRRRGPLDLATQAELMRGLLDALGIERVVVVAHDVGGGVAHLLAARHPERVRALVLVDVVAFEEYWPVFAVQVLRVPLLGELLGLGPQAGLLRGQLERGLHDPGALSDGEFWRYFQPLATLGGRLRFLHFLRGLDPVAVERAIEDYAESRLPAHVVWGRSDRFQPIEEGRALHARLAGSTFVAIPAAGHFLPEERPRELADEVRRLLARVADDRP